MIESQRFIYWSLCAKKIIIYKSDFFLNGDRGLEK